MEYKHFFTHLVSYLEQDQLKGNQDFQSYIKQNGQRLSYQLAEFMVATFPSPRVSFYKNDNMIKVKDDIL